MYSHGQTTDVKIDIYEIMPVKKKIRNHGDNLTLAISVNKARLLIMLVIVADNKPMFPTRMRVL